VDAVKRLVEQHPKLYVIELTSLRACLKDVPDNLIFHLKRFDFNLRTLQRSKINDHFAFPTKIDMRPYQVEYLMDNPEEVAEDVFELVGVLVHSGTAESGHYYSFIRERPSMGEKDTWVEFNDDSVSSWDPSLMEHATFGGFEFRGDGNVSFDKSYSAYMLFYQRSSVVAAQQQALVKSQKASPVRTPLPPVISNHIALDNELLMRKYCIYDPSQIQLATKMLYQVRNLNGGQCSEQHLVERKALFMALNHLDQVVTRTKDLPDFPNFMMMIKQMCSSCVECTRDYLEWYCSYPETLRYMLLRNPDSVVRNEVAASILQALQKVKSDLPYAYGLGGDDASIDEDEVESDDPRILQKIVVCLHKLWDIFQSNCRAWPEYFGLLSSIATLGAPEAVLLLDAGYLKKTLEVVSADSALPLTPQLSRMLAIVSKRFSTRPVQFDAVIALLWNLMSVCDRGSDVLQDNVSRFGLLADEESRVPFNIGERDLFCQRWTRSNVLILVEKLLILNQNTTNSHQIIAALMSWDEDDLDPCIYAAISSGIKRVSTTTPAGSYLRAAVVYCKHTETNKATHLLDQIIRCARDVDNSDGREFLRFFKQIVRVSTSERSHVQPEDLHNHVLRSVGMWAPPLLTYYDAPIRVETEEFLTEFILSHGPDVDFGTSHEAEEKASIITEAGQKLGIACLKYLDDTFVRVRQQAVRSALVSILSIIENCEPFFDEDQGDAHSHQYFDLRSSKQYLNQTILIIS
jgi:ubiquitin carboxyl-terminal hydrolase 34